MSLLWPASLTAAVAALDVATKALAEKYLDEPRALVAGAELDLSHNTGIAFGALGGLPAAAVAALGVLAFAAIAFVATRGLLPGGSVPFALLAGGAIGNLIDRLPDGRVTDFIDPPAWPAFNLADVAIVAGVVSLLVTVSGRSAERSDQPG